MGIIYCYTNKINGKRYIGQTINPEQRYSAHKSAAYNKNNYEYKTPFHAAIRKYGWENFDYTILVQDVNDIDLLNSLECYYIKAYNSKVPNGYNILDGGSNAAKPKSIATRQKLTWAQAELTPEEILELRLAYYNKQSPKKIYDNKYKDRLHYNAFLNIWSGRRYKNYYPELLQNGRHTKLTQEIADQIRQEYKTTKTSYEKLGEKYNISKSTIADIIKNRTWTKK